MPSMIALMAAGIALVLVVGVLMAHRVFKKTVDYRLPVALRKARALPIGDTEHGAVAKVVGRVELAAPAIRAPLSKRVCVCYRVRLEREVEVSYGHDNTSTDWEILVDEARGVDFYVRDASGLALVRYDGAESLFDEDERFGEGTFETAEVSKEYAAFCRRHGADPSKQKLRCTEGVLEVGEEAHVLGTIERGDSSEPVVIARRGDAPLFIADASLFGSGDDAA